jgi:hypothetical protein
MKRLFLFTHILNLLQFEHAFQNKRLSAHLTTILINPRKQWSRDNQAHFVSPTLFISYVWDILSYTRFFLYHFVLAPNNGGARALHDTNLNTTNQNHAFRFSSCLDSMGSFVL